MILFNSWTTDVLAQAGPQGTEITTSILAFDQQFPVPTTYDVVVWCVSEKSEGLNEVSIGVSFLDKLWIEIGAFYFVISAYTCEIILALASGPCYEQPEL